MGRFCYTVCLLRQRLGNHDVIAPRRKRAVISKVLKGNAGLLRRQYLPGNMVVSSPTFWTRERKHVLRRRVGGVEFLNPGGGV